MMAAGLRHPSDRVQDAALGALWGLGSAAAPASPGPPRARRQCEGGRSRLHPRVPL